jgi:hypothetical protein
VNLCLVNIRSWIVQVDMLSFCLTDIIIDLRSNLQERRMSGIIIFPTVRMNLQDTFSFTLIAQFNLRIKEF